MSLGDELRQQVTDILLDIQSQLTELARIHESAKYSGVQLFAMKSHNNNVMLSAARLHNEVVPGIEDLRKHYQVIIQSLEDYASGSE